MQITFIDNELRCVFTKDEANHISVLAHLAKRWIDAHPGTVRNDIAAFANYLSGDDDNEQLDAFKLAEQEAVVVTTEYYDQYAAAANK